MKCIAVQDRKTERIFLDVPVDIYKDYPHWIRPLDQDIISVFDRKKNGIARPENFQRWVLQADDGKYIGRVAAFINPKTKLKNNDYPVGGMGFFECVEDREAAYMLFDTARDWLKDKGVSAMEGPINFGDRDKFWGLLTEGYDYEPNYLANYHPPYYKEFFESYGFQLYFNQFTYMRYTDSPMTEAYLAKAEKVLSNPDFEFKHIKKKKLESYIEPFRSIYNKAWANHAGVAEMPYRQAKSIFMSLKPVIDERIAWFGYHKGEPIAFFIMIPELNQIFKHLNGNLNLWGKIRFLIRKNFYKNEKMLGIIFGVVPEFDGYGVTNAITRAVQIFVLKNTSYKVLEMHGIGDFNPAMIKFIGRLGYDDRNKVHTTYRYMIDPDIPYSRMPLKSKRKKS